MNCGCVTHTEGFCPLIWRAILQLPPKWPYDQAGAAKVQKARDRGELGCPECLGMGHEALPRVLRCTGHGGVYNTLDEVAADMAQHQDTIDTLAAVFQVRFGFDLALDELAAGMALYQDMIDALAACGCVHHGRDYCIQGEQLDGKEKVRQARDRGELGCPECLGMGPEALPRVFRCMRHGGVYDTLSDLDHACRQQLDTLSAVYPGGFAYDPLTGDLFFDTGPEEYLG